MNSIRRFQVVILPDRKPAASHCTLQEAAAFVRGYEEATEPGSGKALIAAEPAYPAGQQSKPHASRRSATRLAPSARRRGERTPARSLRHA